MGKIEGNTECISGVPGYRNELTHIQGIAQIGPDIILTSNIAKQEIMIAAGPPIGNSYKYMDSFSLPDPPKGFKYEHAGGIDGVKNEDGTWYITVPVYKINEQTKKETGAVFLYRFTSLPRSEPSFRLETSDDPVVEIEEKAYAAGIARIRPSQEYVIVLAVVCASEGKGKQVKFFGWNNFNWTDLPRNVSEEEWGGNGLSLLSHQNSLYLVSLKGDSPWYKKILFWYTKNNADLYQVNISATNSVDLQKCAHWEFQCKDNTSFRWGGSARLVNDEGKIEVLACDRDPLSARVKSNGGRPEIQRRPEGELYINRFHVGGEQEVCNG